MSWQQQTTLFFACNMLIRLIKTAVSGYIVDETRDIVFKTVTKCRQQENRKETRRSLPIWSYSKPWMTHQYNSKTGTIGIYNSKCSTNNHGRYTVIWVECMGGGSVVEEAAWNLPCEVFLPQHVAGNRRVPGWGDLWWRIHRLGLHCAQVVVADMVVHHGGEGWREGQASRGKKRMITTDAWIKVKLISISTLRL